MANVIELQDSNFKETIASKPLVLVDIYASWCGPCRLFSPIFEKVSEKYKDKIPFYKIDGDDNPNCRDELTIDNLPYIAAYRDGKFVKGFSTSTEEGLEEFIQSLNT